MHSQNGLVHPVVNVPLLGWLKVMEYDRTDMVLLGVTASVVVAFLLYMIFGPW